MKIIITFILFCFLYPSAAYSQGKSEIETLVNWMTGSFNSEQQSKNDSDYFNISLEMHRIWNDRKDGYWLYVEQALAETRDKPYRQRIYHLVEDGHLIKSIIYSIPNESNFVGGWKKPALFDSFSPSDLERREGCEVVINRKDKNTFLGSTVDDDCISNLRGAAYATTKVVITKNTMVSWDQGFNSKDEQVWGAVKGGYIFNKVNIH